jgi:hypothetical protein
MATDDARSRSSLADPPGIGQAPPAMVRDGHSPRVGRPARRGAGADPGPDVVPIGRRYGDLLQAAYTRGWTDGCFAAPLEPTGRTDSSEPVSQGLGPADFARSLWGRQAGTPPAGLVLNAPLWYARGFADALTADAHR